MAFRRNWLALFAMASLSLFAGLPGQAAEKVTLRLDWSYWGGHAPFFVAVEKGFFARQGLDVPHAIHQRRDLEAHHVQAIKQILAEIAAFHKLGETA